MDSLFANSTLDDLANTPGTDVASGPGTVIWRTWADEAHRSVDVFWETFAQKPAARQALLVGIALVDGDMTGVLVHLELAGKRENTQRCIPLSRLHCLRRNDGTLLHGEDQEIAMNRQFLVDAATRWLHSTAKEAKVIDKHAQAFDSLAQRLNADAALRRQVLLECVQAAKNAAMAQSRLDAFSG